MFISDATIREVEALAEEQRRDHFLAGLDTSSLEGYLQTTMAIETYERYHGGFDVDWDYAIKSELQRRRGY